MPHRVPIFRDPTTRPIAKVPTYRPPAPPPAECEEEEEERTERRAATSAAYRRRPDRIMGNRFYAGARWRALRAAFLLEHPLCDQCESRGRLKAAEHVHHKQARRYHPEAALDWSNLQALCARCHNRMRGAGAPPPPPPDGPDPPGGGSFSRGPLG